MSSLDKHHLVSQGCKSHFLSAIMFRAQHNKAHTVAPNTPPLGPNPPRHLFIHLYQTLENKANDKKQQCKWLYTSHNNVHKSSEFVFDHHPSGLNFPLLTSLWFCRTNCELMGCSQTSGIGGWHGEALFWVPHFHTVSLFPPLTVYQLVQSCYTCTWLPWACRLWTLARIFFWCPMRVTPILLNSLKEKLERKTKIVRDGITWWAQMFLDSES